jgi:cytoskeletal protein RodZ
MNDFGGKLRQAREARGLTLRQIATSTKISAPALEALERNDISRMPGGIFSRGFVRSYAIEVGLDPDATIREFVERFDVEPPPAPVHVAVPEVDLDFERHKRRARIALTLLIVGVLLGGIFLYWSFRTWAAPASQVTAAPVVAPR